MNERIARIVEHPLFQLYLKKIEGHEINRIFCKHDLAHLLDTARILYILCLEQKADFSKDVLYGTALLHDIGRWCEYETGEKHSVASARLCEKILLDCHYTPQEVSQMKEAISNHQTRQLEMPHLLSTLLYDADKKSRPCFGCKMEAQCDWSIEKKVMQVSY